MLSDRTLETRFGMAPRTIALRGDAIRAISTALVVLLTAALTIVYVRTVQSTIAVRHLQDFGIFYDSAVSLGHGGDPSVRRGPSIDGSPGIPNLNPPHFHLIIWPFTWMPPAAAFVAWVIASLAALVISLVIISRQLQLRGWGVALLVAFAYLWTPMVATLLTGQVGLVLMLPFTLAWASARSQRFVTAGGWLGACASVKPPLLLFIPYLAVTRRLRAAASASIVCIALLLVGVALAGVAAHREWIRNLMSVTWIEHYMNASLLGWLERSLSTGEWQQRPVADLPGLIRPLWLAISGVIAVVTLWRVTQMPSVDRQFLLVTLAALLISPVSWIYYLWFLLPALAARLASSAPLSRVRLLLIGIAVAGLLVPPSVPWMAARISGPATLTIGSIYALSLALLWSLTLVDDSES
jgi:alpha-1,2-mannosyltransferase